MLDLKLLTTFREVALRRSFSDAATALGYTQPAVSQHVSRLETAVGVKLLERDARGVKPTPAGDLLLLRPATLLDAARRAEDDVRAAAGLGRSTVTVGTFPTAAAGLLPTATRELRSSRPDLRIDIRVLEPEPALDELVARRLDMALLIDSELQPVGVRNDIEHVHLCDDPLMLALPSDHPLAGRASVGLEELAQEPWLMPDVGGTCEDSNIILRACHDAGFEPDVRLTVDDYNALQGMAAAGVGVALIPTLAASNLRADVAPPARARPPPPRPARAPVPPRRGRPPMRRISAALRIGDRDPLVEQVI